MVVKSAILGPALAPLQPNASASIAGSEGKNALMNESMANEAAIGGRNRIKRSLAPGIRFMKNQSISSGMKRRNVTRWMG